jgi:arabinogalactan endo-1,4-beta-galactosidase
MNKTHRFRFDIATAGYPGNYGYYDGSIERVTEYAHDLAADYGYSVSYVNTGTVTAYHDDATHNGCDGHIIGWVDKL